MQFCGVGGGITTGDRSIRLAVDAEFQGAIGVVLNKPATNEMIKRLKDKMDIPIVITVVSENEDIEGRIAAGIDVFNVSGADKTENIIKRIRDLDDSIAIIATGGRSDETIQMAIEAGANAISYTPPTTAELFKEIMQNYRK